MSFQNRAGSTVAIQQTKLNVFQYQRQAVFQCGLLGVNAFGCGKITQRIEDLKEEIGVRMPPALPLHTVRARIICGFRLVSETGSGSSSSDLTLPAAHRSGGIHRAAIGLNAGALPVRRPRKSVTGSYRPPAYRCQSAQGRFWRCPCGQCAGYATQFVMKSITQRFNVACRTRMYAVR